LAKGNRKTAPIAIIKGGKTPSFANKKSSNLEAYPEARASSEPSQWRFLRFRNSLAEILDDWST